MSIRNTRIQHPVGQGGFHSGEIDTDDLLPLSYVYDCGAMKKYSKYRDREIRQYLNRKSHDKNLDILFLSHIHADHVNGLPQLLDKTKGLRVDTIVLPLINVIERLIAFARTAAEDRASTQDGFYRDFIIDPANALERFSPRQIIFFRSSGPEGRAPDDEPISPRGPIPEGRGTETRGPKWKLIGSGEVEQISLTNEEKKTGTTHLVAPDSTAIYSHTPNASWILAPYVDPGISTHQKKFLSALSSECHMSLKKLESWLEDTKNIEHLVTSRLDCLAAAYTTITNDLNITSLCLYSGPSAFTPSSSLRKLHAHFGCVSYRSSHDHARIAWLGSGDAALKALKRRKNLTRHYGQLLNQVSTMTLPHHGSDHNFDPDIISRVGAQFYVAAADRYSTWKHPGTHVVQSIYSSPALLQVVTSSKVSAVNEVAKIE